MKSFVVVVAGSLAAIVLSPVGCSSSSDSGSGSTTDGGTGGSGGDGAVATDATVVCGKIAQADVQALYTSTVSGNTFNKIGDNFDCGFELTDSKGQKNHDTHARFYVSDADEHQYGLLKTQFPTDTFHDLAGVGDKAYWFQAIEGQGVPTVVVHEKDATCSMFVADALENTTCHFTGTQDVSAADATTYATAMGKVCVDVLAGNGH